MIKTMKIKSCVAALLAAFTLGVTTSCADMFDIDSNRVVYNHEINTLVDSAYTTLGVLTRLQKLADRYVILGEVRGDMADINDKTKTSLRDLANFEFENDNEYLNVRDFYAVINNCNYALAHMDTAMVVNNKRVMVDEYAALIGIRAWTYLQLLINYGDVYYYTYPITSEADIEKAKNEGKKNFQFVAEDLASQLIPFLDYDLPSFVSSTGQYPILRLVLADLYLWTGNYQGAVDCYEYFFMKDKKNSFSVNSAQQPGYRALGGLFQQWKDFDKKIVGDPEYFVEEVSKDVYTTGVGLGTENLAYIDKASELNSNGLFKSGDNSHYLNPSEAWLSLTAKQMVFRFKKGNPTENTKDSLYRTSTLGDLRKYRYYDTTHDADNVEFGRYEKFGKNVNIYRSSVACLRWAEAMNALASERHKVAADSAQYAEARALAENSFYLLKDASRVFFPDSSEVMKRFDKAATTEDDWRIPFLGIHGRGCGDVRYDTTYYVLKPAVIANSLGKAVEDIAFGDTIEYIENLIIDELALESTLEGNRFGDLIRFAERRGDVDFLAKRVAGRKGEDALDTKLYEKLSDKTNWYLPFK